VNKNTRLYAGLGASLCLTAVVIGAFGAHALGDILSANQRQDVFDLANRYHFYHGLAIIALTPFFAQMRSLQLEGCFSLLDGLLSL